MILALVLTSVNGDETPYMGETIDDIVKQLDKENLVDGGDYDFEDIKWYELGCQLNISRETVYHVNITGE